MTVNFRGYVFQDDGDAVSGATVKLLETGTTTTEASTTTDSDGLWYFNEADQDRYDVEITEGNSVRYIRWDDQVSFKEVDVRNNTGATTPAATFTNLTNSAANQVAVFSGANSTKADDDEIYLSFKLADSAGNLDEFARMTVVAKDVSTTTEDGQIEFDVMKAGTLTNVWTITSSTAAAMSFDMNVDALTIGSGADTDITLTFDANSADGVITWMEDEDYFKFSDDILMNSTERINFYDTAIYIYSSTDGQLDIIADTEIQIAATTIDIDGAVAFNGALTGITNITLSGTLSDGNYTFDTSGNVSGLGTVASAAITSSGIIKTDDGTDATSTTDGSLQTDGGLSVAKDAIFGNDVKLLTDSAVLVFGAGSDATLTHTNDTGLTLNSTNKLMFNDATQFIQGISATVLGLGATDEIDLTATAVDLNGTLDVSGATVFQTSIDITGSAGIILENDETITNSTNGLISLSGNLAIPDGGTIGSASDTDSITISSGGVVTMDQIPVFSAGINVSGGTIAGTLATAVQGAVTSVSSSFSSTIAGIVASGHIKLNDNAGLRLGTASGGTGGDTSLYYDATNLISTISSGYLDLQHDVLISGTTPTLTIGDSGTEDATIIFDGNSFDAYIATGYDETALIIGQGQTVGTNERISIYGAGIVFNDDSANFDFRVESADNANMLVIDGALNNMAIGSAVDADVALMVNLPTFVPSTGQNGTWAYLSPRLTEAGSGTHANMVGVHIAPLANTNAGGATTNAATFRIGGAPTGATPTAGNFAMWVQGGTSRFDGDVDLQSGHIIFPATQSASAGANTLDDYEEGTWTPEFTDADVADEGQAYSSNGNYTKIGNRVFIEGNITATNLGSLGDNLMNVTALPFTANATNSTSTITMTNVSGLDITAGQSLTGLVIANTTRFRVYLWDATTGTSNFLVTSELTADGGFSFSGSYRV
jgi:hypothetical protein